MGLTHFDGQGNAIMVNVGEKEVTKRRASARGKITVNQAVYDAVTSGTAKKGDVLGVARVAGIMGAKKTAELVPLCHTLLLTGIEIEFSLFPETRQIEAVCTVTVDGKTGVEMEALTGVSVALLTIYDMCKALDKTMEIGEIYLWKKSGGKSGDICNEKGWESQ